MIRTTPRVPSPRRLLAAALLLAVPLAPLHAQKRSARSSAASAGSSSASVDAARKFMEGAEREITELSTKANRAQWVAANFITDDTEGISADATKDLNVAIQRLAIASKRFDRVTLPAELRRKMTLLKLSLAAPPPGNPADATELTRISSSLEADYGKGTYCRPAKGAAAGGKEECLQINALSRILVDSRDPNEMLDAWQGWHRVGAPMRERYARFVELSNKGARELGFADAGAMWRSNYDMPPDEFAKELDRLWTQVRPLYLSLHAYVRARLSERYGPQVVPPDGMIPAHLLGNMWAQEWGNVYPLVAPKGASADPGYDLTALLKAKNTDAMGMARYGEGFFTSMGLPKLPPTFYERSLFVKPRDRDVVCHASAWTVLNPDDVRIKMCTEVTGEDFVTVHHEEGHDFYYMAYRNQPILFQNGANDGFHEAIGDAIALSITPDYLKTVGLLDRVPPASADTALLLRQALDKVAFLPFGLLIDQWRWKVFSGEVKPASYNAAWWELRNRYQGVSAPLPRSEADFDPGAKYHVPANTPYTRYFLARVLQFQFYRAMCREAGFTGPLHRCSFYGNKQAGAKLSAMLSLGQSKPWPDALEALTGERRMDAGAMLEYFAPLQKWLDEQNRGRSLGWDQSSRSATK
ncbi:MAG TPA: M2 family metallopeptidase [Gemmatimonadaceae bacterium]|nr:M2 family metallopeptidase [Gemmatimonadaceae bacterium]